MMNQTNYMQRVGNSSCIRCDFETDGALTFEQQDAAMMAHLAEKHPDWMTDGGVSIRKDRLPIPDSERIATLEAQLQSQQAELERLKVTEFLIPEFLEAMADIGRYGFRKYGDQSFQARRLAGDNSRGPLERCKAENVCQHAKDHLNEYRQRTTHDHFGTLGHQLAAAAFNAMMEFYFSRAALNPPAAEGGDGK